MLHPHHKLQTRLQLIKRLVNTQNCETIIKCILALTDNQQSSLSYNSKLSFYFNSLINNNNLNPINTENLAQITNNDKEILSNLNQILCSAGLNYKNELNSILSLLNRNNLITGMNELSLNESTSNNTQSNDSTYLLINVTNNNSKSSLDLATQMDKEFDDEILKIYYKSKLTFSYFLDQFDKLTHDLNDFSCNLTNQVVLLHSSVRKLYFQRLKTKFIKSYDIKQKWIYLIENMTHEKCVWYDETSWPSFTILDQTEGPNRERRRLKSPTCTSQKDFLNPM